MNLKVLGSVSPYCKNTNNCPGYLIEINNKKILLDCGNGITSLMSFPNDLKNLTIIISHLHKDHYGDLLTLGYATFVYHNLGLLKEKIKVYIPDEESIDKTYLENFDEHFLEFVSYNEQTILKEDNITISFKQNPHPIKTYSIKIKNNDKSIVYSSDTGYQNNTLEEFAKKTDLLICETTFLKDQKQKEDDHLSTIDAGIIAKNAQVKQLMITHTWPEIDKDIYQKETKTIFENTIIASEGKILKIGK